MKKTVTVALLLLTTPALAAGPDARSVAERVVGQVAGVKEGEVVVITAPDTEAELAAQLGWAARRKKADFIQQLFREKDGRRSFDELPAELDTLPQTAALKLTSITDMTISVSRTDNLALMKDVPEERRQARWSSGTTLEDAARKRGVRSVDIGNGIFPTDATAKRFGMKKADLEKLFWSSVDVDYSKLQATGEAVKAALGGKVLKIKSDAGTDLTMAIEKRPVSVSDGIISDADRKAGGANLTVWLPAGEVYLVPVPGTAEGTLVLPRSFSDDVEIVDLALTIKAGKVVDAKAKKGLEAFKKRYDAAGAGKDELGYVDLGVNPALLAPKGSKLQSWVSAGTVTVGIGNNQWAGGTNLATYGYAGHLTTATVTVDDKPVVEKGVLKVGGGGA